MLYILHKMFYFSFLQILYIIIAHTVGFLNIKEEE